MKPLRDACTRQAWPPWELPWSRRVTDALAKSLIGMTYLDRGAKTDRRARAMGWIEGLTTATGCDRAERVRRCGEVELCYNPRRDVFAWRHRWCRDRACPACQHQRTLRGQAGLRQRFEERMGLPFEHLGVTLTTKKLDARIEGPKDAAKRHLAKVRRFTRSQIFQDTVTGYARTLEVVWKARGWSTRANGSRYFVECDGWHAHTHWCLEVRESLPLAKLEELRAWWTSNADGLGFESSEEGQKWQHQDERNVGQLAKYITKPFELPPDRALVFFRDMAHTKLVASGGTWAGSYTPRDDERFAPHWAPQGVRLHELLEAYLSRGSITLRWRHEQDDLGRPYVRRPSQVEVMAGAEYAERTVEANRIIDALWKDPRTLADRVEGREIPAREGPKPSRGPPATGPPRGPRAIPPP